VCTFWNIGLIIVASVGSIIHLRYVSFSKNYYILQQYHSISNKLKLNHSTAFNTTKKPGTTTSMHRETKHAHLQNTIFNTEVWMVYFKLANVVYRHLLHLQHFFWHSFTAHTNLLLIAQNTKQTNRNYTAQSLILLLKLKTKEIQTHTKQKRKSLSLFSSKNNLSHIVHTVYQFILCKKLILINLIKVNLCFQ
jgi:hypothetical protein